MRKLMREAQRERDTQVKEDTWMWKLRKGRQMRARLEKPLGEWGQRNKRKGAGRDLKQEDTTELTSEANRNAVWEREAKGSGDMLPMYLSILEAELWTS